MSKFNINFGKNEGDEAEITFGGKEGDKFRVKGPADQLKGRKPGADGILIIDELGTGSSESSNTVKENDDKSVGTGESATNLGNVSGLAIGEGAQGDNVLNEPGTYHIANAEGLAIGSRAKIMGLPQQSETPAKVVPPKPIPPATPSSSRSETTSRPVEEGLGGRIIGKYSDMTSLKELGASLGFEINDEGRMAFAREVNKLVRAAQRSPELAQKLTELLSK